MSEINSTNAVFSDLSLSSKQKKNEDNGELGQSAFLKLMITQLENQDPLSPQDNGEFIAQLAQFSSVESLDKLNNNFESFANTQVANQALQASTLVGRSVSVPTDVAMLRPNDVVTISANVPSSSSEVKLDIYNSGGGLVEQISLGQQPAGELVLRWDGQLIEQNGQAVDWQSRLPDGLPPGQYQLKMSASVGNEETALGTAISANVNSVTVGSSGELTLNLAGIGAVPIDEVKQFNE